MKKNKITRITFMIIVIAMIISCIGVAYGESELQECGTSYAVKCIEEGTSNVLTEKMVINDNLLIGQQILESAPIIEGFLLADSLQKQITIGKEREIIFYYKPNTFTSKEPSENVKDGVMPRDQYVPTDVWNIAEDGSYNMRCNVNISTMYTNYKFCGATEYEVQVENYNDAKLTIYAKSTLKTYEKMSVAGHGRATFYVKTDDPSKKFYVKLVSDDTYVNIDGFVKRR